MTRERTRISKLAVLLLATVTCACAGVRRGGEPDPAAAKLDAAHTFNVAQLTAQTHLAVEVEITAEGVRPLGARVVRGPARSGSALQDLVVRARAGERVVREYTLPDPRLVEADREGARVLEKATAFLYAPLLPELTQIELAPVAGREQVASRGGTIDPRPLAAAACEKNPEIPECRKILGR